MGFEKAVQNLMYEQNKKHKIRCKQPEVVIRGLQRRWSAGCSQQLSGPIVPRVGQPSCDGVSVNQSKKKK